MPAPTRVIEYIESHSFAVKAGCVGIPFVNVKTGEHGIDWEPIPTTIAAARDLLGY